MSRRTQLEFFKKMNAKITAVELSLNKKALDYVRKEVHAFVKDVFAGLVEYSPHPHDGKYSTGQYSRSFAVYAEYKDGRIIGDSDYSFDINDSYGNFGRITTRGSVKDIRGVKEVLTSLTRFHTMPSTITIYNNARGKNNFPYSHLVEDGWHDTSVVYKPFEKAVEYAIKKHPSIKVQYDITQDYVNYDTKKLIPTDGGSYNLYRAGMRVDALRKKRLKNKK